MLSKYFWDEWMDEGIVVERDGRARRLGFNKKGLIQNPSPSEWGTAQYTVKV